MLLFPALLIPIRTVSSGFNDKVVLMQDRYDRTSKDFSFICDSFKANCLWRSKKNDDCQCGRRQNRIAQGNVLLRKVHERIDSSERAHRHQQHPAVEHRHARPRSRPVIEKALRKDGGFYSGRKPPLDHSRGRIRPQVGVLRERQSSDWPVGSVGHCGEVG